MGFNVISWRDWKELSEEQAWSEFTCRLMDRIRIRRVSRYFVGEESFSRSFGSVLVFNDGIIYLYISCTPENYHSATSNQCVKHKDAPQGEKNKRCTWQVYVNEGSVVFCFLFYFFFFEREFNP